MAYDVVCKGLVRDCLERGDFAELEELFKRFPDCHAAYRDMSYSRLPATSDQRPQEARYSAVDREIVALATANGEPITTKKVAKVLQEHPELHARYRRESYSR